MFRYIKLMFLILSKLNLVRQWVDREPVQPEYNNHRLAATLTERTSFGIKVHTFQRQYHRIDEVPELIIFTQNLDCIFIHANYTRISKQIGKIFNSYLKTLKGKKCISSNFFYPMNCQTCNFIESYGRCKFNDL
jgi:hypothetical protein